MTEMTVVPFMYVVYDTNLTGACPSAEKLAFPCSCTDYVRFIKPQSSNVEYTLNADYQAVFRNTL